jgi:hypothetical protein
MKHFFLVFLPLAALSGCVSSYDTQQSTLAVDDRIDVLQASVSNPYPECDAAKEYRRVANLSVDRSERVYLQEGALCQRSD